MWFYEINFTISLISFDPCSISHHELLLYWPKQAYMNLCGPCVWSTAATGDKQQQQHFRMWKMWQHKVEFSVQIQMTLCCTCCCCRLLLFSKNDPVLTAATFRQTGCATQQMSKRAKKLLLWRNENSSLFKQTWGDRWWSREKWQFTQKIRFFLVSVLFMTAHFYLWILDDHNITTSL